MNKSRKFVKCSLVIVLVVIIAFCGYMGYLYIQDGTQTSSIYDTYISKYNSAISSDTLNNALNSNKADAALLEYQEGFKTIRVDNQDIVGWIKIADTNIDYPVLQGEDNDFYLKHNPQKEYSFRGSIFMDYRNNDTAKDQNTILYGHYVNDKSMFYDLKYYKEKSFYTKDGHDTIEFNTYKRPMRWQIFSVTIRDGVDEYDIVDFENDEEYQSYLDEIVSKSIYDTGVNVTTDDRILTLSTCSYEFDNARLVIHAKLVS